MSFNSQMTGFKVYQSSQWLMTVRSTESGELIGRIVKEATGWFYRREDRIGDAHYRGARVTDAIHAPAKLSEMIAAEMARA